MDKWEESFKNSKAPQPDPNRMREIGDVAQRAYINRNVDAGEVGSSSRFSRWHYLSAVATPLLVALVIWQAPNYLSKDNPLSMIANRTSWLASLKYEKKALKEFTGMFAESFKGAKIVGDDVELDLSEATEADQKRPVIVEFQISGQQVRYVTFSGASIKVPLNSEDLLLEVLVTGDSEVLLLGEDDIWNSEKHERIKDYEFRASVLEGNNLEDQ